MPGVNGGTTDYIYCVDCDGAQTTIPVTLEDTFCGIVQDGYNGDEYHYFSVVDLWVTIPYPVTCDIPVRIKWYYEWNNQSIGGGSTGNETYYKTLIIPAGQTEKILTYQTCEEHTRQDQFTEDNFSEYFLDPQQFVPECEELPGCTIGFSGYTTVNPSLLGSTDGSITVYVTGNTGSSYTFRLNAGVPQSSNVFSGLGSGVYQVRVDEGPCNKSIFIVLAAGAFNTSDFFVTQPRFMVASENPIPLFISTAQFDPVRVHSETLFTIQSGISNNYRLVFNLTSPAIYQATFTAKDFPNKSQYFLSNILRDADGVFQTTNNNTHIANSLAQSIVDDPFISQYYYVNTSGASLTLKAKIASSRFDLTTANVSRFNASTPVTTGITITQIESGTDRFEGDLLDNYSVFAEVYVPIENKEFGEELNDGDFNRLTELQLPYNPENVMKFDFSTILKSQVSTPKPDYEFTGFTTLTTYMQPCLIKYGEVYPLIANTTTKKKRVKNNTNIFWVLNAALNFEVANDMRAYTGETSGGYLVNVPFLTNSPEAKWSSRRQKELLYFIVPKDLNEGLLDVRGTVYFWDGTSLPVQTFYTISTGSSINFGGSFCINVSFDNLGLNLVEASSNRLIKELNISVYSGNGARFLTKTKTYKYYLEERPNRIGLSWLNKLGTFDSFDFTGLEEDSIERSSKDYTVPRDIRADGSSPIGFKSKASYDVLTTKKATINSGWIDQETFDWLLELVSSNEIYIYSADYDNYVTISGFKYSKSTNDNRFNIELQITWTSPENNISI